LRIGREIAAGLAAAHERQLIIATSSRQPLARSGEGACEILDFGLARAVAVNLLDPTRAVMGTPQYMAPEQARGEKALPQSDLFSLGCVLYRMITGELPFKGTDVFSILSALALHHPKPPASWRPARPGLIQPGDAALG